MLYNKHLKQVNAVTLPIHLFHVGTCLIPTGQAGLLNLDGWLGSRNSKPKNTQKLGLTDNFIYFLYVKCCRQTGFKILNKFVSIKKL